MTVAVTGASGHIGANLVRAVLKEGGAVRAVVHRETAGLDGLDVERVRADVRDAAALQRAFEGAEVVYHLAGIITFKSRRDEGAESVNVGGTRNVVAACQACNVKRLVHFSSIHAFSAYPRDKVVDETRPRCGPGAAAYDRSKADAEDVVMAAVEDGLDAIVVNPTGVIGPCDFHGSAMGRVLLDLYRGRLPAMVQGGFNWVDARDVCVGAMAAAESGRTGQQYLLAGHYLTIGELAARVAALSGEQKRPWTIPLALARAVVPLAALQGALTGRPPRFTKVSLDALCNHQRVSHEKARRELGYAPRPIETTLKDTFDWFRKQGILEIHERH